MLDEFASVHFQCVHAKGMISLIFWLFALHVFLYFFQTSLELALFMFYSSLLLGFGELSLESLLCWEKTVTCQYWNQPYDFWSLLNTTSHKHRGKKGRCSIMFWYKNKTLIDLQTFAVLYISKAFTLLSQSDLRRNKNNIILCNLFNFIHHWRDSNHTFSDVF